MSNKEGKGGSWAVSIFMAVAKGLEGLVIDTSSICRIDSAAGRLIYRGCDINDLAAKIAWRPLRAARTIQTSQFKQV